MVARDVHREFNTTRNGANMRFDHTVFARYALKGIPDAAREAFTALGYADEDYTSLLSSLPATGNAAWVLSFWADADFALYKHRGTGESVPLSLHGIQTNQRDLTIVDPDGPEYSSAAATLHTLQKDFEFTGMIGERAFKENARMIMARAAPDVRIFILMANELVRDDTGRMIVPPKKRRLNGWVRDVASEFPNAELVDIRDFIQADPEMKSNNHFDRMVYFRVFQHIMRRVQDRRALQGGAAAA
jgi:hypothetical protein